MASEAEAVRPVPTKQDQLGERDVHKLKSTQEVKTDVGAVAELHIEAAVATLGSSDAELEARLKRLEQLRIQYGVRGPKSLVPGLTPWIFPLIPRRI